jgi:hypothetical protein
MALHLLHNPLFMTLELAGSWAVLLVFDSIIFSLTLYNGWSVRRTTGVHSVMALHTIIIRDGALYPFMSFQAAKVP